MTDRPLVRWNSLAEARLGLRELWGSGRSLGSVHTLGDLHEGHAEVIRKAATENEFVVVSIVPNTAQLARGTQYRYNKEADSIYAHRNGATHVITPDQVELYPPGYSTFLNQGECYNRLDATVVPFLFRGMITMSFRWICFTRPTRTYWGLKDIGQFQLVRQAVLDFGLDTEVREVPCVRFESGCPISSRLLRLPGEELQELGSVYWALQQAREMIVAGETSSAAVIGEIIRRSNLKTFRFHYVKVAKPDDFSEPQTVGLPLIVHCALTNGTINHFDGMFLRNERELMDGPPVIWLSSPSSVSV